MARRPLGRNPNMNIYDKNYLEERNHENYIRHNTKNKDLHVSGHPALKNQSIQATVRVRGQD